MRAGFGLFFFPRCALKRFQARLLAVGAMLALAAAATGAPLPPPRPPEFTAPETAKTAPQIPPVEPATPQTSQPPAPGGRQPADVDVNRLQPYNLPPATREKMHQCGDEWRKLKMAGKAAGLVWRSFAEKCLVR
jgi:hypothetical protein